MNFQGNLAVDMTNRERYMSNSFDAKLLAAKFGEQFEANVALARYTSARIGGIADGLLTANSVGDLESMVRYLWEQEIPFIVLGGGSNVLVSDAGVRGLRGRDGCSGPGAAGGGIHGKPVLQRTDPWRAGRGHPRQLPAGVRAWPRGGLDRGLPPGGSRSPGVQAAAASGSHGRCFDGGDSARFYPRGGHLD